MKLVAYLTVLVVLAACGVPIVGDDTGDTSVDAAHSDVADDVLDAGDGSEDGGLADASRDTQPAQPPEDLEGFIEFQMASGGIAGAAIAVIRDGEVVHLSTHGFANVADEVPVAEDTSFAVASISKPFALVSALRQQEAEQLDLDASIRELLPEFPIENLVSPDAEITTRMLLTHTAGIGDDFLKLAGVSYEGPPVLDLEGFSRSYFLPDGELYDPGLFRAAPGTARNYCNACYGLLGYVVEEAADLPEGEDFRSLNRRDLIDPLELGDTHWFFTDVEPGKLAIPYSYSRRRFNANPSITQANYPAGSLYSSIRDLVRFARMWLGEGTVDDVRVLSEASVEETLMTPFPDADASQRLAFSLRRHGEVDYISQSGATIGGAAQFLLRPEVDGAIIVLTNSDAYIRSRLGQPEGADAIEAIVIRLQSL